MMLIIGIPGVQEWLGLVSVNIAAMWALFAAFAATVIQVRRTLC